jgi:hypothetical protein
MALQASFAQNQLADGELRRVVVQQEDLFHG